MPHVPAAPNAFWKMKHEFTNHGSVLVSVLDELHDLKPQLQNFFEKPWSKSTEKALHITIMHANACRLLYRLPACCFFSTASDLLCGCCKNALQCFACFVQVHAFWAWPLLADEQAGKII